MLSFNDCCCGLVQPRKSNPLCEMEKTLNHAKFFYTESTPVFIVSMVIVAKTEKNGTAECVPLGSKPSYQIVPDQALHYTDFTGSQTGQKFIDRKQIYSQ